MSEKNTPRVFSINLQAYLLLTTDLHPDYHWDEETNSIYFVFPEVAQVKMAIAEFRYGRPLVKLHDYLNAIRVVRHAMREQRSNGGGPSE